MSNWWTPGSECFRRNPRSPTKPRGCAPRRALRLAEPSSLKNIRPAEKPTVPFLQGHKPKWTTVDLGSGVDKTRSHGISSKRPEACCSQSRLPAGLTGSLPAAMSAVGALKFVIPFEQGPAFSFYTQPCKVRYWFCPYPLRPLESEFLWRVPDVEVRGLESRGCPASQPQTIL